MEMVINTNKINRISTIVMEIIEIIVVIKIICIRWTEVVNLAGSRGKLTGRRRINWEKVWMIKLTILVMYTPALIKNSIIIMVNLDVVEQLQQ